MDLMVNGAVRRVQSPPDTPLLWVLRDELDLTGTKYGCGTGACGICMVHLDGAAVPSCIVPVGQAEGISVTTIEGLASDGQAAAVHKAWIDADVSQCGYCQPGVIMAVTAQLREDPRPTEEAIVAAVKVLCRCGTYPAMRRALHLLLSR